MILTPQNIDHLNTISYWLAVNNVNSEHELHADVAILAGHAVLPGLIGAFTRLAATNIPLLLSGGIGHSTELLKTALHAVQVNSEAASEAQLMADAALQLSTIKAEQLIIEDQSRNCGENAAFSRRNTIKAEQLIIEDQSRNCGENAAFSRRNLLARDLPAQRIILIQDPLMQRRTAETFRHEWQRQGQQADFISWPVFVPQLELQEGQPVITGALSSQGLWALDRYVSMVLGEVRRLRDDKEGYGPAGLGFIGHVDVPHAVEHAWQRLMADPELAALVR